MTDLSWFELYPPANSTLPDLTAMLRPLATRPRQGLTGQTPVVVFELWLSKGSVRWLLGMELSLAHTLPHQLTAQLDGLTVVPRCQPHRPQPVSAIGLSYRQLNYPLRTDLAGSVALAVMQVAENLRTGQTAVVQWVIGPSAPRQVPAAEFRLGEALGLRPPVQPNSTARRAWGVKVQEPLFGVRGRIGATADATRAANGITRELFQALSLANGAHAQLRADRPSVSSARRLIAVCGKRRRWSGMVNAAELGMLLGWPIDGATAPGSVGPSLRRAPQAALSSAKASTNRHQPVGESLHPADAAHPVALPTHSRLHHLHVIGPTGSGKSTVLAQLALADIAAGHSVLVCEPKGDLIDDILARLPAERHDDVVLIEPSEHGPVVGFNPLQGLADEAERRADELLHLFKELFGSAIGPRSSDVLLHALLTAARLPDGALTDVPTLLTNPVFRRGVLSQVNDSLVLAPFWSWFENLSEPERGQIVAPLMNKLRAFTSRTSVRRLLSQPTPRFDIGHLLTKRRIVLVNLNRGLIGPRTAKLLGSLFLTQLWQTMQRRTAVSPSRRQPVSIVIDEWQDFTASLDFGEVLAQARGLGVGFTLAHQHLGQLSPSLRSAVLANARSRIIFRPAQKDVSSLAAMLGGGLTAGDLERLGAFQAAVRLHVGGTASPPFAIRALPLTASTGDVDQLRHSAQLRYGVDGQEIDAQLAQRWYLNGDAPKLAPVGVTRRTP